MEIENRDLDDLIEKKLASFVNCCKEHNVNIYLVGGVVRDLLLVRPIENVEVDIAGDATVKTLISILPDEIGVIMVNQVYGTCKLKINGMVFDYATMRIERYTSKSYYPKVVSWTRSLKKDSTRRDFTINAIYLNMITRELIDYEGGLNDLNLGLIRCVGDPFVKISEDFTRIFRGVRFAKKYGFALDKTTAKAMDMNLPALAQLSKKHLLEEFERIASA